MHCCHGAGGGPDPARGCAQAHVYRAVGGTERSPTVAMWITSPFGEAVDSVINAPTNLLLGRGLIDNGVAGTVATPTGSAGGVLFGDGGDGWNSTYAGIPGGDGGAGGLFGDGGAGGAGDGSDSSGLPALGGAGGNGGLLGTHGAVGQYGTLTDATDQMQTAGTLLPLNTTGSWMTNSDGQVVLLHGLNEVVKVAPNEPSAVGFSDEDAAFLAANGFNVVRLGVIWSAVEPEPGVYNDAYLASIDQTVQMLASHGIYAELDFHQDLYSSTFGGEGAPAWAVQSGGLPDPQLPFALNTLINPAVNHAWDAFWSNADAPNGVGLENSYAQMLEHTAAYFNGNPDVVGFEIMNEPGVGDQLLPIILGSSHFDAQELTPFYDQAGSAIRAVEPSTPVFFEPNVVANAGLPTHLGTVDVSNTIFSFHDYCAFQLGPLGCVPNVAGIVDDAAAYAQAHDIPAFMTEFGATSDQSAITPVMQPADQNLLSWTEWAYTGQGDITTSASPPGSKSLVYDLNLPSTGTNVNTGNLDVLSQPYPQVVSGTPNSFTFDNGTFQFSYSTAMANGDGSFAAGSQTDISVPTVQFPDGYQVRVTGGEVVSAANAPELVIASAAAATTVTVTAAGGAS